MRINRVFKTGIFLFSVWSILSPTCVQIIYATLDLFFRINLKLPTVAGTQNRESMSDLKNHYNPMLHYQPHVTTIVSATTASR